MEERRIVDIAQAVLAENDRMAAALRAEFDRLGVLCLNVMSSPGAGKTALLERTLSDLAGEVPIGVVVGDLATDNDAARLRGKGARVVQVTTDGYCHLEANMVRAALDALGIEGLRLLIVENVGNLVCPASHDLGEHARVVLFSVTEGEDKPLKYPTLFKTADLVLISKTDLAAAVEFRRDEALEAVRGVAPQADVLEVSAKTGLGLERWYAWLRG
ncbi:MAG: hydrogenase nickel incorporation protein HypB, partial [Fimbriimonadaceae bacterium]